MGSDIQTNLEGSFDRFAVQNQQTLREFTGRHLRENSKCISYWNTCRCYFHVLLSDLLVTISSEHFNLIT